MLFFFEEISKLFELENEYVWYALFNALLTFIYVFFLGQRIIKGEAVYHGGVSFLVVSATAILGVTFVVGFNMGLHGRVLATVIPLVMVFIVLLFIIRNRKERKISLTLNVKELKEIFSYGLPLIPHLIGSVLLVSGERFVLNHYMTIDDVALSAVSIQFVSVITIFGQSINKAYIPWLYKKLSKPSCNDYQTIRYGLIVTVGASILMMLVCHKLLPLLFVSFVGNKYLGAVDLISPLAISAIIQYGYFALVNFLFFNGNTKHVTFISLSVSLIHMSTLWILIPIYGLISVSYSFLIVRVIQLLLTSFFVIKKYPELFRVKK